MNKLVAWIIVLVCILTTGFIMKGCIVTGYTYEKEILSNWEMADRSSTLAEKSVYIDKFIKALKESKHADHDAIIFKTPMNSFDYNLKALQSLKDRLDTIKTMDEKSFEYQAAIQQITAQEQGEASAMLNVFKGCYTLENCWYMWEAFGVLTALFIILLTVVCIACLGVAYDWK